MASAPFAGSASSPAPVTEHDYLWKVLLIGNSGVGKTGMLTRFCDDEFKEDSEATIGVDFRLCSRTIDRKRVKIQLWDTAGQERFRTITASYYRGSHGVIVVYDITDRTSFQHVRMWMEELGKYAKEGTVRLLVGNKCDLASKRCVSQHEGRELAEELGVHFLETSAKNSHNIEAAFAALCRGIKERQDPEDHDNGDERAGLRLRPGMGSASAGCCGQ